MARGFHILCVGKLRDAHLEALEADYLKRITKPPLQIHELKASSENKSAEGQEILRKIRELENQGPCYKIAMTEWGKTRTSVQFADWTSQLLERSGTPLFIIAGAEGFADSVLQECQERISLSELTFPHKIARILLVEQLYRAQTIRTGHPYHN